MFDYHIACQSCSGWRLEEEPRINNPNMRAATYNVSNIHIDDTEAILGLRCACANAARKWLATGESPAINDSITESCDRIGKNSTPTRHLFIRLTVMAGVSASSCDSLTLTRLVRYIPGIYMIRTLCPRYTPVPSF